MDAPSSQLPVPDKNQSRASLERLSGLRHAPGESPPPVPVTPPSAPTVDALRAALADHPYLRQATVVESLGELPADIQSYVLSQGLDPTGIKGVFGGGQAYLVASHLESVEAGIRTALHEVVGHVGVRALLGERFEPTMGQLYRSFPRQHEAWQATAQRYGYLDTGTQAGQIAFAEELTAHLAESDAELGEFDMIKAEIRSQLREQVPDLPVTELEIKALIQRSRESLIMRHGSPEAAEEVRQRQARREKVTGILLESMARNGKGVPDALSLALYRDGSRVFDVDGLPCRLYHGAGIGVDRVTGTFWGATSPELANHYAGLRAEQGAPAAVIPFYANIQRPFDADALKHIRTTPETPDGLTTLVFAEALIRQSGADERTAEALRDMGRKLRSLGRREESGPSYSPQDFWYGTRMNFGRDGAELVDQMFSRAGFDGVRYTELGCLTYGAFSAAQLHFLDQGATPRGWQPDRHHGEGPMTERQPFREWFGDSKVVDAEGRPEVMYHGTTGDITAFQESKIRPLDLDAACNGFWFSSSRDTSPAMRDPSNIMPVYLSVQNPAPYPLVVEVSRQVEEDGKLRIEARSDHDEVRYRLQEMGYDGFIFTERKRLTEEQREAFERDGVVTLTTNRGGSYQLRRGTHTVRELQDVTYEIDVIEFVSSDGKQGTVNLSQLSDLEVVRNLVMQGALSVTEADAMFAVMDHVAALRDGAVASVTVGEARLTRGVGFSSYPDFVPTGEVLEVVGYYDDQIGHITDYGSLDDFESMHDERVVVAFRPEQIKSAIGNRGSYLRNHPDVRFDIAPGASPRLRDTPAFREWFGQSRLVSETGAPLVLYHGTGSATFTVFDPERAGTQQRADWGNGVYLTPHETTADRYRREAVMDNDPVANAVFRRYEALVKRVGGVVADLPDDEREAAERLMAEFRAARRRAEASPDGRVMPLYVRMENPFVQPFTNRPNPDLGRYAREAGHDGIIVLTAEGTIDEVIAFEPAQLKSAIDNNGVFDRTNPDIRFSLHPKGFERWFQASKVVNEAGQPRVVYHGTPAKEVTRFQGKKHAVPKPGETLNWTGEQEVIFFTSDKATAKTYGKTVIESYLSLQNPLVVDAGGKRWGDVSPLSYLPQAVANGHDGIVVDNIIDVASGVGKPATTYIAFDPDQVIPANGLNKNTGRLFALSEDPYALDIDAALTEAKALAPRVQAAYEQGQFAMAERLDARLESLYQRLEDGYHQAEEDGPSISEPGQPAVNDPAAGEPVDDEAGFEHDLGNRYFALFHGREGEWLSHEERVATLRAVVEDYAHFLGGIREGVSDGEILAAGAEAYQAIRARHARGQAAKGTVARASSQRAARGLQVAESNRRYRIPKPYQGQVSPAQLALALDTLGAIDGADPYAAIATRPDTSEAQLQLGRSALEDLHAQLTSHIQRHGGKALTAGESISLLGASIGRDIVSGRPAQLLGQSIGSPADLAALAQVYRDPRMETLRFILMLGDEVVGETAVTSRLPGVVDTGNEQSDRLRRAMSAAGADSYYLVHNHPSGTSAPSSADEHFTRKLAAAVRGFRGHVVIDYNEFSVIDSFGASHTIQAPHFEGRDFRAEPTQAHSVLGSSITEVEHVAEAAKRLNAKQDHAVIIGTGRPDNEVMLLTSVPNDYLEHLKAHRYDPAVARKGIAAMRQLMRLAGSGGHAFLVPPPSAGDDVLQYEWLARAGLVVDVVSAGGRSLMRDHAVHPKPNPSVVAARGMWREDLTTPFERWFKQSHVVDQAGKPKVVYHGSPDVRGILAEGFAPSMSRGSVYFFSDDQRVADTYADGRRAFDYQSAEPNTLPVYLSLQNPYLIDAAGAQWRRTEHHVQAAKDAGHDGIIIRNSRDEYNHVGNGGRPSTVYAVFDATQIKSAATGHLRSRVDGIDLGDIRNRGTYDRASADIRLSFAGEAAATADRYSLGNAKRALQAGMKPELVRQQTGWHRGVDGGWRFEIDDSQAALRPAIKSLWHGQRQAAEIEAMEYWRHGPDRYSVTLRPANAATTTDFIELVAIDRGILEGVLPAEAVAAIDADQGVDEWGGLLPEAGLTVRQRFTFKGITALALDQVLEHPRLFSAYPQLRNVMVRVDPSLAGNARLERNERSGQDYVVLGRGYQLSNLLHEVQHAIQVIEGFAQGGTVEQYRVRRDMTRNQMQLAREEAERLYDGWRQLRRLAGDVVEPDWPDAPSELRQRFMEQAAGSVYDRLAGEVEARNTQARLGLSEMERRQIPPQATQDTPDESVIVVFGSQVAVADGPVPDNARRHAPHIAAHPGSEGFRRWFGRSVVVDQQGQPLKVFRGEHGRRETLEGFHARAASITFSSAAIASQYALVPNEYRDIVSNSRVLPVYLTIEKPAMYQPFDPFLELSGVIDALGWDKAADLALEMADWIEDTSHWLDHYADRYESVAALLEASPEALTDLYLPAYPVFDSERYTGWFRDAGFDGAVHGGCGVSAGETEYRIFSPEQARSALDGRGFVASLEPIRFSLAPAKVEQSSAFKRWFGASQAVDAQGEPLKVFHGSPAGRFGGFDTAKLGSHTRAASAAMGFFFTSNEDVARTYYDNDNIEPEVIQAEYERQLQEAVEAGDLAEVEQLQASFDEGVFEESLRDDPTFWITEAYLSLQNPMVVEGEHYDEPRFAQVIAQAKDLGHDGVIFRGTLDAFDASRVPLASLADSHVYVVFDTCQITLAGEPPEATERATGSTSLADSSRVSAAQAPEALPRRFWESEQPLAATNFERWFGASRVVDGQGKPLVVYKGMYPYDWRTESADKPKGEEVASINRPELFPSLVADDPGIQIAGFFGDIETANRFASFVTRTGAIYPVYLSLQQPYEVDAAGASASSIQFGETGHAFREAMRSGQFDGAIIRNTSDEGTLYLAARPEQIKSVFNVGSFSPSEADIRLSFAGEKASSADRLRLDYARRAIAAGMAPALVREHTGWEQGVDGQWRFEIDDSASALAFGPSSSSNPDAYLDWMDEATYRGRGVPLTQALHHPELFAAYPQLKSYRVMILDPRDLKGSAALNRDAKVIYLADPFSLSGREDGVDPSHSALLHEIQHAIQDIEGFAQGGDPDHMAPVLDDAAFDDLANQHDALLATPAAQAIDSRVNALRRTWKGRNDVPDEVAAEMQALREAPVARELAALQSRGWRLHKNRSTFGDTRYRREELVDGYRRLAGEVEARNVQARAIMSQAERQRTPPAQTEDVAREKQLMVDARGQYMPRPQATSGPNLSHVDTTNGVAVNTTRCGALLQQVAGEMLELLDDAGLGFGWLDGGCRMFAEALCAWSGGKIVLGVTSRDGETASHVVGVLALGDEPDAPCVLLDADGVASPDSLLVKLRELERSPREQMLAIREQAVLLSQALPFDEPVVCQAVMQLELGLGDFAAWEKGLLAEVCPEIVTSAPKARPSGRSSESCARGDSEAIGPVPG